jgi:hypothetical protein
MDDIPELALRQEEENGAKTPAARHLSRDSHRRTGFDESMGC